MKRTQLACSLLLPAILLAPAVVLDVVAYVCRGRSFELVAELLRAAGWIESRLITPRPASPPALPPPPRKR